MDTEFKCTDLELSGLRVITPFYVEDNRGFFLKSMEKDVYKQWGLDASVYEDFESYSKKGVIRGLHFQTRNPQVKIVRAIQGTIRDVAVDLRKDSPTFGKHEEIILSDENHYCFWIPEGFAHGFEVLSDFAIVSYKCVGKYLKGFDSGIRWNDSVLNISWETENPIVSERDSNLMTFPEFLSRYQGL